MIELTEEEFNKIYKALQAVNNPYSKTDVDILVTMEFWAWEAVQEAAKRNKVDLLD
jgi:hypothetical protein